MTEASTKVSNSTKAAAAVVLVAVFTGALSWAGWTTLSLINVQTNLATLTEKIDAVKEVKVSDDRRLELDAEKLDRRLASIEGKLDRALGLAGAPVHLDNTIRNHNENTVLVQAPDTLATLWKMIEFNEEYSNGLRERIAKSQHGNRVP